VVANTTEGVQLADWRRRVAAMYEDVRRIALVEPSDAHEFWRANREELFRTHPSSPLVAADGEQFTGLPITDYQPEWRYEVHLVEADPARWEPVTGTDGVVPFERIGRIEIADVGSLDVWWLTSYGGGLFAPVKDALAGRPGGTYGGGRYLLDTVKGADLGDSGVPGTVVVDFNFAYNPSCAYDPAWACPLAPAGNVVDVEIPVGERVP
jgi:uncharacterized protein (DUF1684 family)